MKTVYVTAAELLEISSEADRGYYGKAIECGGFATFGGIDHVETQKNGWGIIIHDRGCNGKHNDTRYLVPLVNRTGTAPL